MNKLNLTTIEELDNALDMLGTIKKVKAPEAIFDYAFSKTENQAKTRFMTRWSSIAAVFLGLTFCVEGFYLFQSNNTSQAKSMESLVVSNKYTYSYE